MEEPLVRGMIALRVISACIEVGAAAAMLRLSRAEQVLRLNALLGLVGPTVFLLVSALGLAALAGRVSPARFGLVALGVLLVVVGTRGSP